jgi:ABC-type bacteriocin/lantibiotic exporter with double-glycine peptidase domain
MGSAAPAARACSSGVGRILPVCPDVPGPFARPCYPRFVSLFLAAVLAATALDVPFVAQDGDTCGPAALAMVLRHWGHPAAVADLAAELQARELHGVAGSRLAEAARARGLAAVAYRGDLGQLREFVGKGRPLIVAWGMGRGRFHDVVVIGFRGDDVVVHDPADGPSRAIPARTFAKRWDAAGRFTLLVMPSTP